MSKDISPQEWDELVNGHSTNKDSSGADSDRQESEIDKEKLNLILDVPIQCQVVVGRTEKQLQELLHMRPGRILETEHMASQHIELRINNQLVALGEVVVVGEFYGMRIKQIAKPVDIIEKLKEE